MTALQIHIDTIGDRGLDLDQQVDAETQPILRRFSDEEDVRFTRPVHLRIRAVRSGETVILQGSVSTAVQLVCSRCLASFECAIRTEFSTTAVPEGSSHDGLLPADELELRDAEMDLITFQGERIDLRDEIAQQVIMALPFSPICRKSCRGLCSGCGVDLNQSACRCSGENAASPFAVLKRISFPDKKA